MTAKLKRTRGEVVAPIKYDHEFLSTGSTLLNLALSDRVYGGLARGKITNIIGDSHSGKTLIALCILAERTRHDDEVRPIYDDAEHALEEGMLSMFGKKLRDRIEFKSSSSLEEGQNSINEVIRDGDPFIYITDSLDALPSLEEQEQERKAVKKMMKMADDNSEDGMDEKVKGSYRMAKPSRVGRMMSHVVGDLKDMNSDWIIISQTRTTIGSMFQKKRRAGGAALDFYPSYVFWTATIKTLKRGNGQIGSICRVKVTKTKTTGKVREVTFPIIQGYGVDDTTSCVQYLVDNGWWEYARDKRGKKTGRIAAIEFDTSGLVETVVKEIEDTGRVDELRTLVQKCWDKIEDEMTPKRIARYE